MTIDETKKFLRRIKSHYQEFVIDDFKREEWHDELKKYDYEDVNKKFEEHLRSETYGDQIPKLYFLTRYLTPLDKKSIEIVHYANCPLCEKNMNHKELESHYARCSAINYIERQSKKYYGKELQNKETLYSMPLVEFNRRYDQFLHGLLDKPLSKMEAKIILKILYPEQPDLVIQEMLREFVGREEKND